MVVLRLITCLLNQSVANPCLPLTLYCDDYDIIQYLLCLHYWSPHTIQVLLFSCYSETSDRAIVVSNNGLLIYYTVKAKIKTKSVKSKISTFYYLSHVKDKSAGVLITIISETTYSWIYNLFPLPITSHCPDFQTRTNLSTIGEVSYRLFRTAAI